MFLKITSRLMLILTLVCIGKNALLYSLHHFSLTTFILDISFVLLGSFITYITLKLQIFKLLIDLNAVGFATMGSVTILIDKQVIWGGIKEIARLSHSFQKIYYGDAQGTEQCDYNGYQYVISRNKSWCVARISPIDKPAHKYANLIYTFTSKNIPACIKNNNEICWQSDNYYFSEFEKIIPITEDLKIHICSKEEALLQINDYFNEGVVIISKDHKILYYNAFIRKISQVHEGDDLSVLVDKQRLLTLIKNDLSNSLFFKIKDEMYKITYRSLGVLTLLIFDSYSSPHINYQMQQLNELALRCFHDIINVCVMESFLINEVQSSHQIASAEGESKLKQMEGLNASNINICKSFLSTRNTRSEAESTEITQIIENWVRTFETLQKFNVTFEKNSPEVHVAISQSSFSKIIFNLFKNAADAMSNQTNKSITIKLYTTEIEYSISENPYLLMPGQYAQITIKDNGPGLPHKVIESLTTSGAVHSSKTEGHGMGLRIISSLINEHKGLMRTTINEGTQFDIYLPLSPKIDSTKPVTQRILNIVVIEDMKIIQQEIVKWLTESGHNVFSTDSVEEFFGIMSSTSVDVVVFDANIHGTDISDTIEQFSGTNVRFLITSAGYTGNPKSNKIFLCPKPFNKEKLLSALNTISTR